MNMKILCISKKNDFILKYIASFCPKCANKKKFLSTFFPYILLIMPHRLSGTYKACTHKHRLVSF